MSDVLKAKRKKLAQPLRDLALTYKTYRVRDDATRKKVEGMASALLKKRGVPAEKKLEATERGSLSPKAVDAARQKVIKTANSYKNIA